jgi:hypothetical protein
MAGIAGGFGGAFTSPLLGTVIVSELAPTPRKEYIEAIIPQLIAATVAFGIYYAVRSLGAQNMDCIKIGKDFMFSHDYIKDVFDADEWAAPEFLERAAAEVLKEEWGRRSWSKVRSVQAQCGPPAAFEASAGMPGPPSVSLLHESHSPRSSWGM